MGIQKTPRRWFRFRLRTLLIMVTLVSVPLGWVGWELDKRRKEKAVAAWVEGMGGKVLYKPVDTFDGFYAYSDPARFGTSHGTNKKSWWEKTTDEWFGERVWSVDLRNTEVSDLSLLKDLKNLQRLSLGPTSLTELSALSRLKNLDYLGLVRTPLSDEHLQELQQTLPNCEVWCFSQLRPTSTTVTK